MVRNRSVDQDNIIRKLVSRSSKEVDQSRIELCNKNSHIICMNIGELNIYKGEYDEAAFWLQLAMSHASKIYEFDRVIKALTLTAQVLEVGGLESRA